MYARRKKIKFSWSRQGIEQTRDLLAAAFNGSESDDSENDDESYNESIEAVVRKCFSK